MSYSASTLIKPGSSNQDRALVVETRDGLVMAIADGAGGMGGGAEAADAVIDAVRQAVAAGRLGNWTSVLREVDQDLADRGQTTAVVALVQGGMVLGASVGDSAAWVFGSEYQAELTCHQQRKPLIGSARATPVPFAASHSETAVLVLGSDGLFKYTSVEQIRTLALSGASPDDFATLVQLPTGDLQDDLAVILCRCTGSGSGTGSG